MLYLKWSTYRQAGFTPILILVSVLVIGLVLGVGYYLGKSGQPTTESKSNAQQTQPQNKQSNQFNQAPANGPQNDKTYFTTSSDPKSWSEGTLVSEQASVPDIIQLNADAGKFKKGDILVYFVDFSNFQDSETLGLKVSSDNGKNWSDKYTVEIKDKASKGAAVDPSLVQLPDGRLRLYYFGSEATMGTDPASVPGKHKVYSVISSDGVNFTGEDGIRFEIERLTDPEIILYKNQYYMYYSVGPGTFLAVSSDGLTFTSQKITGGDVGGVPGAVAEGSGVRIFGCRGGIASAVSADGITFNSDTNDVFGGKIKGFICDPAVVKGLDGKYLMVYKYGNNVQPGGMKPMGGQQPVLPPLKPVQ